LIRFYSSVSKNTLNHGPKRLSMSPLHDFGTTREQTPIMQGSRTGIETGIKNKQHQPCLSKQSAANQAG
jgi:hypothetical protein